MRANTYLIASPLSASDSIKAAQDNECFITGIRKLKRIQRRATEMVLEMKNLIYKERLKETGQSASKGKRRGEYLKTYKIVNHVKKIDIQDLVVLTEDRDRWMRGHTPRRLLRINV